ncbi:hypothetical protein FEZ42_16020 [Lactiplantibacillus plantarum]|uniref:Uncharacterized protein n=1 Tax=Bifidobacterium longum TaxID=216816 RepID=A0A6B1XDF7_BIFLN|nr:hypothetical protein [Lactiplantibacillus plantarum]MZU09242.1 hypothetical protein [Bifidobacterium longum]MBO2729473.1 hypothetical protein [Lactiplantibacillus plantarum]MCT0196050.1 hypothetical protein [Lactiplantibacillus plantarum]RDF80559.1 hypothetical protein DQM22_13975 [Lactiplantibacillus plantarum]
MLRKLTFIVDNLNGIAKTRIINITNFKQSTIFKGSRIFGVGKYFHSKSTRPFLITKKGI